MTALFDYPASAAVGRSVPKNRIYTHASPSTKVRGLFVSQLDQIVWRYKLAPETVRLGAKPGVAEIQLFELGLKSNELDTSVLQAIDKAVPFPLIFELSTNDQIKVAATYKRPNEADPSKWVIGDYYESDWLSKETPRKALPVVLDLGGLYEQLLRALIAEPARRGENLRDQVERIGRVRAMRAEQAKMKARLRKEKQFNKKVEINAQIRALKKDIDELTRTVS